ncbi:MAG: glycosyltransferase family 2 protein [Candidatus Moranbacteria bacterium]|nr:glycosyltransferase family 2 protein [Candidatus Moranbacteria bacterium]
MQLSIIVTSYKNPALLKLCLEALRENIKGISYEVVVSDGETGEDTSFMMKENFPQMKFLPHKENVGFGGLVNEGLKEAKGNFCFIINGDIIVKEEKAVAKLIDYYKKNENIGLVGPKLINFDNTVQDSCFRFYKISTVIYRRTFLKKFSFAKKELDRFLMKDTNKENSPVEADWIMGSAMLVSRENIEKIGVMDRSFFMYFEDVDWCWRFWEKGLKVVYNPWSEVYHYHGKQSANKSVLKAVFFNKYARVHLQSALKFFWKHKTLGWRKPYSY